VIELYAITAHPAPPLPNVAPLREVTAGSLTAVCGPAQPDALSAEQLWAREEVVEALMADRDILPVRYGTRLSDEAAAARALEEHHPQLAAALDRVRGAREVSVRVLGDAGQPANAFQDDPRTGREYLREKAREVEARSDVVVRVHDPLRAAARASVLRPARLSGELLRAAYLVGRQDVDRFVALVGELQDANPDLQLLCTGPWPPYSFADQ
jgi:hypothetical protein